MNAMIREKCEAPVAAHEPIEVSIACLRVSVDEAKTGLRELNADNKSLRDKIDQSYATFIKEQIALRDKIDDTRAELCAGQRALADRIDQTRAEVGAVEKSLGNRIEQTRAEIGAVEKSLGNRIDQTRAEFSAEQRALRDKLEQSHSKLNDKIEALARSVADVRSMQRAMLWVIGGAASLAAVVEVTIRIGRTFHWF